MDQSFPKDLRLRRRCEFQHVYDCGKKIHTPHFVVLVATKRGGVGAKWRMGITVSKRVGNAVVRNRIKRWVREAARRDLRTTWPSVERDVVVIAKRQARSLTGMAEVCGELRRIGGRW